MMLSKMNFDFSGISLSGRIAYTIMCAERYALAKYPEKNWKPLFTWMWKCTSDYFDEWYYRFMEILPEYLYEFDNYKDAQFEYLSEQDYNYYSDFLKDIDKNMKKLMVIPTKIAMVYSYMSIPEEGKESIKLVCSAAKILKDNNIELPDPTAVSFSKFTEKNGWGNPFDGKKLSIIIN